jgi:hypothetical protein
VEEGRWGLQGGVVGFNKPCGNRATADVALES